ncbi:LOW QUALITY PROTEIN: hypothetical protein ACJ73_02129 [Blastomyces percursus]|uniref:Uncharacterized protein n=1 Tax=Blastomyces percursus TaxID=1658174 RepID=A0A1J9QD65_9EURO|nr:LOW QUALITY PROTEIN: hypothetical protein ACJ73_02129 [Blastomyces percursus]
MPPTFSQIFLTVFDAFVAVLKDNFRDYGLATEMTEKGEFALFDVGTNPTVTSISPENGKQFPRRSGSRDVYGLQAPEVKSNFCPSCKNDCPGPTAYGVQW